MCFKNIFFYFLLRQNSTSSVIIVRASLKIILYTYPVFAKNQHVSKKGNVGSVLYMNHKLPTMHSFTKILCFDEFDYPLKISTFISDILLASLFTLKIYGVSEYLTIIQKFSKYDMFCSSNLLGNCNQ